MADSYILSGGIAVLPDRLLEGGTIVVKGGTICHVGQEGAREYLAANPGDRNLPVEDCASLYILPRLVEMHIHGAFGLGFENIGGGDDIVRMARALDARGIGCFVPTILWDERAVAGLVEAIGASGLPESVIPGIYIEGPFINPAKRGGINLPQIAKPDAGLCRKIIDTARGRLRIMALAPELPGVETLYPILREAGVLVSLGHSGASGGVATPPPPFSVTHLFNAMSGLDHRGGGLANIALGGVPSWTELNADGIHVNASSMKVAARCIPPERLILTSDAVVSAGLGYGDYRYFGKSVTSDPSGVRYSDTQTLIGSNKLGMEIVKSFMAASGSSLSAAVRSMSATPSAAITHADGAPPSPEGGIAVGAAADLYMWDRALSACHKACALRLAASRSAPESQKPKKGMKS